MSRAESGCNPRNRAPRSVSATPQRKLFPMAVVCRIATVESWLFLRSSTGIFSKQMFACHLYVNWSPLASIGGSSNRASGRCRVWVLVKASSVTLT